MAKYKSRAQFIEAVETAPGWWQLELPGGDLAYVEDEAFRLLFEKAKESDTQPVFETISLTPKYLTAKPAKPVPEV